MLSKKIQTLLSLNFSLNFATLIASFILNMLSLSGLFEVFNLSKTFLVLIVSGTVWQIFASLVYFYLSKNLKNKSEIFLLVLQTLCLTSLFFVNNFKIYSRIFLLDHKTFFGLNIFVLEGFWLICFLKTFLKILENFSQKLS